MKKLWQKNCKQIKQAENYCFKDTAELDNKLVIYDVIGSLGHARMLQKIKIINKKEFEKIKKSLLEIINLVETGKFIVKSGDEDVHTKIENYLIAKLGDLGKKIHTGRSRNDQVLTALRLYSKDNLLKIAQEILKLTQVFTDAACKYEFVIMPGYTHMQRAMPSSVGMWLASFAESLLDDLKLLQTAFVINDQSPLGSAASYGVSLPIDREFTAKLLGFAKVQNNSLYCQASRVKVQLAIISVLVQIMLTLSRFTSDLLLFTTKEFDFFQVDEKLCTGSSIMPQKKNLDVLEIVRARTQIVIGCEQSMAAVIGGLPSGYNADFGETKKPFMNAIETVYQTVKICSLVVKSINPNIDTLKKACTPEIFSTHATYELVKKEMSFREAYKKVGLNLSGLPNFDPVEILKISNHLGGPGNLGLKKISLEIKKKKVWWQKCTQKLII